MIDIVLPALDEAAALPWVLRRIPEDARAIVVDNGSSDGTAEVAREHGATVVPEPRRGFGAAAHAGLEAATAPVVAFCDADASMDPGEIPRLAGMLGDADLVLGRRRMTPDGGWPLAGRLANRVLARRMRSATGYRLTDLGPMRVARREALVSLALADRRSGYPLEMVLAASRAGWRVVETDIDYFPRVGRSKVTGTVRGYLTAVHDMSALLAAHPRRGSEPAPDAEAVGG